MSEDSRSPVQTVISSVTNALEADGGNLRWLLGLLFVAAAVGAGLIMGPGFTVLMLAGGAMVVAIATFWTSLRALFGETKLAGEDAYALGAPSTEEEQKRAVLRAIKDLEFEHGVGKISDEDYGQLIRRYRSEAKRLLRMIDEKAAPRRAEAEALVDAHLAELGLKPGEKPKTPEAEAEAEDEAEAGAEAEDEAEAEAEDEAGAEAEDEAEAEAEAEDDGVQVCSKCSTDNDADAAFCKKCATPLGDDDDSEDDDGEHDSGDESEDDK